MVLLLSLCLVTFLFILFLYESKRYPIRSKKPNDYSRLVKNLSEKRKINYKVVGVGKRLRLEDNNVILENFALKEEDKKKGCEGSWEENDKATNKEEENTELKE